MNSGKSIPKAVVKPIAKKSAKPISSSSSKTSIQPIVASNDNDEWASF
jgi:hypothetical protein